MKHLELGITIPIIETRKLGLVQCHAQGHAACRAQVTASALSDRDGCCSALALGISFTGSLF